MAQDYSYPSSSQVTISGIGNPTGQPAPTDAVYIGGENPSGDLTGIQVDPNGYLITTPDPAGQTHVIVDSSALPTGAATEATIAARLAGSLTPTAFDQVAITYVAAGNGTGQISTVTYSLVGSQVKLLTFSYDAQDRLIGVV